MISLAFVKVMLCYAKERLIRLPLIVNTTNLVMISQNLEQSD